jgi:hypothetical protein
MKENCDELKKTSANSFKVDNRGFTATVSRDKENLVFFSVPYDKGWSATVNGKPCKIEEVNSGFMAVKVSKGESVIRFDYETPYLMVGIIITLVSAIILLLYVIVFSVYKRKYNAVMEYPEGDELISRWKKEESNEPIEEYFEIPVKKSILDDVEIKIPEENKGFDGGFTINTDIDDK